MGDGHHAWACADVINLIRNLLFFEEDDGLVITPILYNRWMEAGECIEVKNAPSHYGIINFKIESKPEKVILNLNNQYHTDPKFIEFSIPYLIKKILLDKKETPIDNKRTFRFEPNIKEVVVFR